MGRQLKSLLMISAVLATSAVVEAKHDSVWDSIIKRTFHKSKTLRLTAGRETKPQLRFSPKIISFKGVLEVPHQIYLTSGYGIVNPIAGQLIFDGHIICNYSPKANGALFNKVFLLQGCSDGSRSKDDISVNNKIELKLNYASSERASLVANVTVIRSDEVKYGITFPYLEATEGQILLYNGDAWVAADPSELNLEGVKGDQGEAGPQGPQGLPGAQGPAGVAGAAGIQGEKGDKGDKGDAGAPGVAGAQGPAGAMGATGPAGLQGPKGDAGAAGAQGAIGPQGPVGPMGPKGDAGVAGTQGAVGPQGPAGAMGPQGPQGPQGADGAPGVAGAQGAAGPMGPRGSNGSDGATGAMGPMGPMGFTGATGATGPQGPAGVAGPQGLKGDKGDRGLTEMAYMRDERSPGVLGGTCTAGQWMTRTLNTLGGDTNFITLAANSFVLQPGTYFIEVVAPGHGINQHQAKLKVIETNSDVLYGTNVTSASNAPSTSLSLIMGEIVVSIASTFEIQHRCATTRADSGFGVSANFGSPEIYTQVKIIKKQ